MFDNSPECSSGQAYGTLTPYDAERLGLLKTVSYSNTIAARLARAVEEAEQRLIEAKRAKEIFDHHPELEELLNIMQKGRF